MATDRRLLMDQADMALTWAKRHGRTSVELFDPAPPPAVPATTAGGRAGLGRRGRGHRPTLLRPVYQPIVDLKTGRVAGAEGLIRPMPGSGFSNPAELFAAAEAAGRRVELDFACLEIVAAAAAGIGAESILTLNMSPRTLEADDFSAGSLVALVRKAGLDPTRIVLELTEREQVEEMERLRRNVTACRAAGFRLAADDVGAGNAGLRLLSQVQFDIVKIDLSLVQGGAVQESSMSVVGALQDLARRWGASVIAEGIETPAQLRVVRALEVGAGQGYLLGRPGTRGGARSRSRRAAWTSSASSRRTTGSTGWPAAGSVWPPRRTSARPTRRPSGRASRPPSLTDSGRTAARPGYPSAIARPVLPHHDPPGYDAAPLVADHRRAPDRAESAGRLPGTSRRNDAQSNSGAECPVRALAGRDGLRGVVGRHQEGRPRHGRRNTRGQVVQRGFWVGAQAGATALGGTPATS